MSEEKFYVSHYVNEPVSENGPLKRIGFITTSDKEITNKTEFYREFDAGKTFTKKDLESEFKEKKIFELPKPLHEIKKNEGIWKDKKLKRTKASGKTKTKTFILQMLGNLLEIIK
ncbi:hypothetical protein HYT91_01095 [Candidatus Pacearchaeota archaeon]|nr:hypothetical protein [Candidatus Pacearchaeota archaeon]